MTGLRAWPSAAARCRVQWTISAAASTTSHPAASTQTTVANPRSPGHCTGRVAAAVATMPVPITEANQFGPRLAKASAAPVQVTERAAAGRGRAAVRGFQVRRGGGARAHDTSVRPDGPVPVAGSSLSTHKQQLLWACPQAVVVARLVIVVRVPLSPHVPDLAALELFAAVARYGSIGAAARHAGISQQAASARLRAMEAPGRRGPAGPRPAGSRLTPAGALLVDWAAPLLAQAGELDSGIASLRRARDAQLRVAASLTVAEHLLPAWLVALRDEYAQAGRQPAEITLVAANSEAVAGTVAEHGVDLGFVEGPSAPRGLRSRVVATDRLVIVVRPDHPWARRRSPVRPAELAATPAGGAGGGIRHPGRRCAPPSPRASARAPSWPRPRCG